MNATKTEVETAVRGKTEATSNSTVVITEFELPVVEFALGETLAALDGVAFEIKRVVAHNADCTMPLVWASGSEPAAIEPALENDPSVAAFDRLADIEDGEESGTLYRMEWAGRVDALVRLLVGEGATLLEATITNDRWRFRLLFSDRPALARTYENCERAGLSVDIAKIYNLDEGRQDQSGLTDAQQEVLTLGFEHGYYEIPRQISVQELAAKLDISHQALSERLRRAHSPLVESAIGSGAIE
jgi:hypothetical protein